VAQLVAAVPTQKLVNAGLAEVQFNLAKIMLFMKLLHG
jgi:hypothetical protein